MAELQLRDCPCLTSYPDSFICALVPSNIPCILYTHLLFVHTMPRIDMRVSAEEAKRWKDAAKAECMSLSEWIRGLCNLETVGSTSTPVAVVVGSVPIEEQLARPYEDLLKPKKKPKTCLHGKEKGFNCWQCGGVARIGIED